MKIKSIEWKNFGSYGNKQQKIEFDGAQGNFYLIVGSNGAGKSTISDVIKFGIYGKVDNKKLRDIPNRFNGNMTVRVVIEKNSNVTATIERGLAPSYFKLYINDVEYDQAGKKNMQDYLEEEIIGIPFYVFNNMVSLSINDFKSFISMGAGDKRMIIDRLFGLELLNHIKWKVKYKLKLVKEYLENIDTEIAVLERSIHSSFSELENLNEKLKVAGEEKKKELQESIKTHEDFIENANKKIKEIHTKANEVKEAVSTLNTALGEHNTEHKIYSQKIDLYQRGKCPTCESDLTSDEHKNSLQEFIERSSSLKELMDGIRKKLVDLNGQGDKLKEMYNTVNQKKTVAETRIYGWKSELQKLEGGQVDSEQTQSLEKIIEDSKLQKKEAIDKKSDEEKKANFLKIVEDVFGDKGVKLSALKRIIPLLNTEIRKVMLDLNMDYRVTFNEEFDVDIQHLGFKVVPEQLSTGERKKVDFAALIALIRLMKIRFAGLNLTFLDEIFSSIDTDGIHHILNVLHKTCRELSLNIFVINHSQLPTEIFDYRVDIQKNNGFSNLMLEKIG
jgi:DNA repair exonuclease SbcCD ATPase subunit